MTITVAPVMTLQQAQVWALIQQRIGRGSAIRRRDLARATGITDRKLRDIIHDLVVVHKKAIISDYTHGGYYLPANEQEVAEHVRVLEAHALSILHRMATLKRRPVRDIQMELPLS